jgi:hypothetical protein
LLFFMFFHSEFGPILFGSVPFVCNCFVVL